MQENVSIILINYTGRQGSHFGQRSATYVQERILFSLFGNVTVVDYWQPNMNSPEFLHDIEGGCLAVINGEGTLHHSRTNLQKSIKVIADSNIVFWLVNALFQYPLGSINQDLVSSLSKASWKATRDGLSMMNVMLHDADSRVQLSTDMTTLLSSTFDEEVDKHMEKAVNVWKRKKELVASELQVVLSSSSHPTGHSQLWDGLVPKFLDHFPMSRFVVVLDHGLMAHLKSKFPNVSIHYYSERNTVYEIIWLLKNSNIYVGGRFHAATLALVAGCPMVLFPGNSWKVESLFIQASGGSGITYVPNITATDHIWQAINTKLRTQIRGDLPVQARNLALKNFPGLKKSPLPSVVGSKEVSMQKCWLHWLKHGSRREYLANKFNCSESLLE